MQLINVYDIIKSLKVDEKTKKMFLKMYSVYCQEIEFGVYKNVHTWVPSVTFSSLEFSDKLKFFTFFNFQALILGPFFYFYRKIFLKGVILLGVLYLIIASGGLFSTLWPLVFLYCALFANRDFFLNEIRNNKTIKENTDVLNGMADDMMIARILEEERPEYHSLILSIALSCVLLFSVGAGFYNNLSSYRILDNKLVCSTEDECNALIAEKGYPPKTKEQFYWTALGQYAKKQYIDAIRYSSSGLKLDPQNANFYIIVANSCFEIKQYKEAIKYYSEAQKKKPKLLKLNYTIGRCFYRMKNYKEAIKYLSVAVQKYPLNPEYKEVLAYSYLGNGNIIEAKKELMKAIKIYTVTLTNSGQRRKNVLKSYYKSLR